MEQTKFLLYKFNSKENDSLIKLDNPLQGKLKFISPFRFSWLFRLLMMGEKLNLVKVFALSIIDFFNTKNEKKISICLYIINNKILSYLVIQDVKYHMPWISEQALEIGAVYTKPDFRGKGLYAYSLETLIKSEKGLYFMIVEEENISSIKGIERAGFKFYKKITKVEKVGYPQYE